MSLILSSNNDDLNYKNECRKQIISMIMQNATNMGWNVEKNKNNVYTLRKKIKLLSKKEKNTEKLVDMFFDINNFSL